VENPLRVFQGAEENALRFPGGCGLVAETRSVCASRPQLPAAPSDPQPPSALKTRCWRCQDSYFGCQALAIRRAPSGVDRTSQTGCPHSGGTISAAPGISLHPSPNGRFKAEPGPRFRGPEGPMEVAQRMLMCLTASCDSFWSLPLLSTCVSRPNPFPAIPH
jgi:hypothetical protein